MIAVQCFLSLLCLAGAVVVTVPSDLTKRKFFIMQDYHAECLQSRVNLLSSNTFLIGFALGGPA